MRLPFPFRRQKSSPTLQPSMAATRLQTLYRRCQAGFATTLSRYERRLSQLQRKFAFFLFCLILGGLSTAWIVSGLFYSRSAKPAFLHHSTITTPRPATLPDSLDLDRLRERQWLLHHLHDSTHH